MINHDFNKVKVADGSEIDLYAAFPDRCGNFPAVIVLQEAFGISDHLRDVAEAFRKKGYAVVAPDLYGRITARLNANQIIKPTILPQYAVFIKDGLAADIKASYNWLLQQDKVIKDKIGCAGFFSDGRVSFLADKVLPLAASVCFECGIGNFTGNPPRLDSIMLFYANEFEIQLTHRKVYDQVSALKQTDHKHVCEFIAAGGGGNQSGKEHSCYWSLTAKQDWALTLSFFEDCLYDNYHRG
jgi:carboxymethylenebutenolidase